MRRIAIAALVLCALGPKARAEHEVSVRVSTAFAGDGGLYATGSSRNLVQGELGYAHTLHSFRRGAIWLEGSWTIGERSDRLFETFDTSLIAQQLTAGVRGTVPIRPWLVPEVRGGAGVLLGSLHVSGLESGALSQTSAAFTSYVLAGLELLLPRPWLARGHKMNAGFILEAGYCFSTALHYSLAPAASPDTVQMPAVATNLGSLSLSGPLLRVGLALRF